MKELTPAQIRKAWEALRDIERDYELRSIAACVPMPREIERKLQAIREVMPSEF